MAQRIFWERYVNNLKPSPEIDNENMNMLPMAISPHGFVPVTNKMMYTEHLDLWNAHTNFDITDRMIFDINEIPGVEALLPLTRYSFRVAFKTKARLFDAEDVKYDIEACCGITKDQIAYLTQEQRQVIRDEKKTVSSYPYWSIFVLPNGQIYSIASEKHSDEFVNKIKLLKETKNKIGGIFLESDYLHVRRTQNGPTRRDSPL